MRFSRFAYLCVALSLFPLCSSSQAQRQMASLRPERGLVWKRASPTVQQPDSPVLYQLIFNSSGVPGTVPVFDTNPRHLTSSPITISGGNVMIGGGGNGLIINGATGIVSFANGQTFPGGTGVSSVTAGNGFITIGGTTANPTVGLNTTATDARYLQLSGGTMTGTITFAPTQTFPGLANLAGEVTGAPSATVVSNAVPANTASAIVRRDGSGNFSAGTINLSGNLALPVTNGAGSAGVISFGGTPFIQNFGGNIFIGPSAGNTTTTGIDNIAIGASALHSSAGQFNNAFGVFALNSMTQAGNNNAFGAYALFSTTGDNVGNGSGNAAFGDSALYSNTLGSGNNAFGHNALYRNTGDTAHNGSYNEAFGDQALFSNTLGSANAAFGASALGSNTTGNFNAAFGNRALLGGTGSFNAAFGYQALFVNNASHNDAFGYNTLINLGAAGSFNTAVGDQAASLLISGNHNIAIGDSAGINLGAGDNNIYIGHPGPASSGASESNTIRIGNAQTQTFIVGAITGNGSGLTALNVNMGNVNGILSISNGGTGSSTQNFVDLANNQSIG
ncbi:MAG TPA: hypothetical protein VFA71_00915, partial [Terriglobales bacterium]|nr:hypothetical protein [Terriglobales bacterium]